MDKRHHTEPTDQEFERAWKVVVEIGTAERHFNQLQQGYRTLASTWLLGAFAGIGFVLNKYKDPVALFGLVALLTGAAGVGIVLLWRMDLLVYHGLMDAFFSEGLELEKQNPWLPKFRTRMTAANAGSGSGVTRKVVIFYVIPIGLLHVASSVFTGLWLSSEIGLRSGLLSAVALLGATFLELREMIRLS